jgi:hypothetical protein
MSLDINLLGEILKHIPANDLVSFSYTSKTINYLIVRILAQSLIYNDRLKVLYREWYDKLILYNNLMIIPILCRTLDISRIKNRPLMFQEEEYVLQTTMLLHNAPTKSLLPLLPSHIRFYVEDLFSLYKCNNIPILLKTFYFFQDEYRRIPLARMEPRILKGILKTNPLILAHYSCYCVIIDNVICGDLTKVFHCYPKYLKGFIEAMISINGYYILIKIIITIIIYNSFEDINSKIISKRMFSLLEEFQIEVNPSVVYDLKLKYYSKMGLGDRFKAIFGSKHYSSYPFTPYDTVRHFDEPLNRDREIIESNLSKRLMIRLYHNFIWDSLRAYSENRFPLIEVMKLQDSFEMCETVLDIGLSDNDFNTAFVNSIIVPYPGWLRRLFLDDRIKLFPRSVKNIVTDWNALADNQHHNVKTTLQLLTNNPNIMDINKFILKNCLKAIEYRNVGLFRTIIPFVKDREVIARIRREIINKDFNQVLRWLPKK